MSYIHLSKHKTKILITCAYAKYTVLTYIWIQQDNYTIINSALAQFKDISIVFS